MVAHFQQLQNPIFDALYCDEERLDEDFRNGFEFELKQQAIEHPCQIRPEPVRFLFEHDLFWEDEEILTLLRKEKEQALSSCKCVIKSDGSLRTMRDEAIKWILKVIMRHLFGAGTAVLAVNYYDRFITSVSFQREKPWMSHLAAVACLSLAAKVEETQVPLLLDFQVEEPKYVFEARTIQRMELLVLSTLEWRMNPVTPMLFFDHILRRFGLITNLHDFSRRCESVVLSIVTDYRLVDYLPSVIAAATMKYVIGEVEADDAVEFQNQLMSALQTSMEKIDDCHTLILESMGNHGHRNLCGKCAYESIPSSPNGVIDAYFNSDSSNESWSIASSTSPSPEPESKRRRVQDQSMRLTSISTVFVGLGKDPH